MRVRALFSFTIAAMLAAAAAVTMAAPAQAYTSRVALSTGSAVTTAGVKLRVTGKVVAPSPRRTVRMQYYAGGTWHTYATTTASSTGTFSLLYPAAYGVHTARVYVSGTRTYRGIVSPYWTVRAYKAGTYVAPSSFTYAGAKCVKSGTSKWTIHHYWRAKGGYYVQLGHATGGQALSQSPVSVYGTDRTWESVEHNVYGARPTTDAPTRDQILAPLGQASNIAVWKNFEVDYPNEVPVSCPV